jgi:hypothetical protein
LVGTTIPHPSELTGYNQSGILNCKRCREGEYKYITASFPAGLSRRLDEHGNLSPYLRTRTSEMSSLYNHREKETTGHLIKKAVDMRIVLNWFVDPNGKLAQSIYVEVLYRRRLV